MKNNLEDLHNHLFMQIERLSDEDLSEDKMKLELNRSRAMNEVANRIIENGRLALDVQKNLGIGNARSVPKWLEIKK